MLRQRLTSAHRLTIRPAGRTIAVAVWARTVSRFHTDQGRDRGANVVETIIIVAGFAILAAAIYAAVGGRVHAWIAKIP